MVYGEAECAKCFKVARVGTIGRLLVRSGTINRKGTYRVIRDGVELYDGTLLHCAASRTRAGVKEGYECGIVSKLQRHQDGRRAGVLPHGRSRAYTRADGAMQLRN